MKKRGSILSVQNLAQIREGTVAFGDFTLIVGPQASGKSIFLQLLKLIVDHRHIASTLKKNNYDWRERDVFLDLFFGEGMQGILNDSSVVHFNGKEFSKKSLSPRGRVKEEAKEEHFFYIPAQRVVTMSQGYPQNFGGFDISDPFVLKSFSETVRVLMEKEFANGLGKGGNVFPKSRRIKGALRGLVDRSIFYGASVEVDTSRAKKRFLLHIGQHRLPFMNWSAGQKEFMPLLLSLYYLMPPARIPMRDSIEWIVIEEPEMGLHPLAIQSVMVICLELIARGYKVIISTHSPVLIELAWAMNYIKTTGKASDIQRLFSLKFSQSLQKVFNIIIQDKTFKTYYFNRKQSGVFIEDISTLDAGSEDDSISNWGGLTEFASRASDIVSKLVILND